MATCAEIETIINSQVNSQGYYVVSSCARLNNLYTYKMNDNKEIYFTPNDGLFTIRAGLRNHGYC